METWLFFIGLFFIYILFFKKKKTTSSISTQRSVKKTKNESKHSPFSASDRTGSFLQSSYTADDDELATFTLVNGSATEYKTRGNYSGTSQKKSNTAPGQWIKPGESIAIQNIVINGGNFYFGGQLQPYNTGEYYFDDGSEASLIDDTLSISTVADFYEDETLGYWPSYSSLSPRCRGAYLKWLASRRNDETCPIGYVFLYFYGIERRVLVDGTKNEVTDGEFLALFEEVRRLNNLFQTNRSFRGYSSRLMELMSLLRPEIISVDEEDELFLSGNSLTFRFRLATAVVQGIPVSPELALSWVKYHTEYALRTPARRCTEEFAALFKQRYIKKYGDGFQVKPNKTRLKLEYMPASGTLRGISIKQPALPDPSVLTAPIQKLIQIADSCTDALDGYSRYLGRKGASRSDIAAIMLLPDEILTVDAKQALERFSGWADERIRDHSGLASVREFLSYLNIPAPDKINKKEAELIQSFAEKAGYGIAPDTRYHHVKPELDSHLVLFEEGHGEFFEPSADFISIAIALRLGVMVAQTDKFVDASELAALERIIDHHHALSPKEKRSLHSYLVWRLNSPVNTAGLKTRIDQLSVKEKTTIGDVIIKVACADGKITPTEIKQLEKTYSSLGLDKSLITSGLHRFSTSEKALLLPASTESSAVKGFSLDNNILAKHESATKDVRSLLSTIFVEDEPEGSHQAAISAPVAAGLDEAHSQLYRRLLEKERWARSDVTELCQQFGLMMSGAIEAINEWSYDKVDAPVFDDGDDIYVDQEIAQELEG